MTAILVAESTDAVAPVVVRSNLSSDPMVSFIMPAYNEQAKIAECVRSAIRHLDTLGLTYEIVVVDDGSTDDTRAEALSVQTDPHVKVVGYHQNRGKGYAIKHGVKVASGDVVFFMDSDANVKLEFTNQYVTALEEYDIAIASKRHPNSRVSTPPIRRLLSYSFHLLVRLLTGIQASDTQSGLKAFRREALRSIIALMCVKQYAFDVEMLTVARLLRLKIIELPVTIELRGAFGVRHAVRMLIDLVGICYRLRVIRWYQENLHNSQAEYKPIIRW